MTARELLDGPGLRDAFVSAAAHLRDSARAVDAINVYPVPDGDTGTNMAGTMREAVEMAGAIEGEVSVPAVLQALAKGALYGARGNSGVILSQALRGFAHGVGERARFDALALADGLNAAAEAAYRAVSKPVEGTMLTVLREAAAGAVSLAGTLPDGGEGYPCASTLQAAVRAAEAAEERTPEQLPALAEAGVTDAGGEGICVILRGLLAAITGEAEAVPRMPDRPIAAMAGHVTDFGYCTEFVLEAEGRALEPEAVRALAGANGNRSVVVVGDEAAVRVHVHSDEPQRLLDAVATMGRVSRTKVEDMSAQHIRFGETGSGAGTGTAVLALSPGKGFDAVFESLGVAVAPLDVVAKPSAGDIAAAADALRKADVVVLPNHKNVIWAAEQAASLSTATLHVVGSATLPQGIAAALAFDPEKSPRANATAMTDAARSVRTVEVTIAAASRSAAGVDAKQGDAIALVDDALVASKQTVADALLAGLEAAGAGHASLVTLYGAEQVAADELASLGENVRARFTGVEVEAVVGGQRLYPVIASVE